MKKVLIILLALILASGFAFAQDKASGVALTPYVDKGELLANVGIGWGGISGGVEFTFYRLDIGGIIPLTFGAAGRATLDPGIFSADWFIFAAGGFGTAHIGFKEINLPSGLTFLSDVDAYAGLGLGFASGSSDYYVDITPGIGISTFTGAAYYLSDTLAINLEYGYIGRIEYWSTYSWPVWYSTVGVILKL
jgi:hypothetical protein